MGGRSTAVLATTVAALRGVLGGLVLVLVLLDSVFGNAAHDRSTDGSEEAVVGLVTCETARYTTSKRSTESTLTILGTAGSVLLIAGGGSAGALAT